MGLVRAGPVPHDDCMRNLACKARPRQGQHTAFGFTDPVLYRLNGTPALHDIVPSTGTPAHRGASR